MTFKHILFPVDYSVHSMALKSTVEWLQKKFDAAVSVVHVLEMPPVWQGPYGTPYVDMELLISARQNAEIRLRKLCLDIPEARLDRVLLEGSAAEEIVGYCERHRVDVIVMGTHGYSKWKGLAMGSVVMKVLHAVDVPVWTGTEDSAAGARSFENCRIVCAVNAGAETLPLLQYLRDFCKAVNGTAKLVHVVPEAETRPSLYWDREYHQFLKEQAKQTIGEMQTQARTDFPLLLNEEPTEGGVSKTVEAENADLLLVGRGKSKLALGAARTHLSSLIRQVHCPILSVSCSPVAQAERSTLMAHHLEANAG